MSATTVATNMAINGDGFFNVQKPIGIVDNQPVFDGTTDYTRRGDFQLNANGNLVNGAGYYLMGVTVDPKTGNPTGNVPKVLQFQNNFIPAQATTAIQYAANLPTTPSTGAASGAVAGTLSALGGLNPNDFSVNHNPVVLGTPAPPFTDATTTGSAVSNKAAVPAPITGATLLSGAASTDSITTNFAAGDTITVNGTPITFVAAGAVGNQLNVTDSVCDAAGQDRQHHRHGQSLDRQRRRRHHPAYRHRLGPHGHQFERGGLRAHWASAPRRRRREAAAAPPAPASSSATTPRFSRPNPSAAAR